MQAACAVIHCVLAPVAAHDQGLLGGDTHLCMSHYLISCAEEHSKLYSPSEPRVLCLCRAACSSEPSQQHSFQQPWNYIPQLQSPVPGMEAGASGRSAAISLLVQCLMASADACAALLPFCCDLLKQEPPSNFGNAPFAPHCGKGLQQQSPRQPLPRISGKLLYFAIAGVLDAVNLHFSSLQLHAPQRVVERVC